MILHHNKKNHTIPPTTISSITCLLLLCLLSLIITPTSSQNNDATPFPPFPLTTTPPTNQCLTTPLPPTLKPVYKVGVLAIRGPDAAFHEFNKTFSDYLTLTAGRRFATPVRFEMKPLNFISLFSDTESGDVDFFYVNPSAYSCIESEYGAHSLVSQISRRNVGGKTYDLTQFGGVIFARADSDVESIMDIKGRSVAAASISGLGSGQMQFRKLIQRGLHYINDPSQIVFTSNQGLVVNGVLYGEFDVGFVRTDQIERTSDKFTGELVDKTLLKIIEPVRNLTSDGKPFPFESTTQLYAEWNVAALMHVPDDVNIAVQEALLALADHASVGERIRSCYAEKCSGDDNAFATSRDCQESCHSTILLPDPRCDTTPELALLADESKKKGKYTGWRSTLTYMELRNMQEETGFIRKNEDTGKMQCIRSKNIYDAVVCPPGHFKKSEEDVIRGCEMAGTPCREGFQCLCKPCVKAFDVNVFPKAGDTVDACEKFSICGRMKQRETIHFHATDNKEREGMRLAVTVHEGEESRGLMAEYIPPHEVLSDDTVSAFVKSQATNYTQTFNVSANKVGSMVMEIFADGVQIPESPFRIYVDPRDCTPIGANRIPDTEGNCICATGYIEKDDECVSPSKKTTIALSVVGSVLGGLVVIFFVIFVVRRVRAIRKLQRDHEMKMLYTMHEAMRSTVNMDYPLHLVDAMTFLREGTLRRHEPMRDEHKLRVLDTTSAVDEFIGLGNLVVFFSHQWTAFDAPDHTGEQYKAMTKALRAIATLKGYDNMMGVWVWVDFSCIPQCNASTQALAIRSLAPYASSACAFIIVAPTLKHKNLPIDCNTSTYQSRMWCRAEQVCYLMRNGPENMFLGTGDDKEPFIRIDDEWCNESLRVFDGQLTCCRLEHKGMAACDRESLVVPILGLFGELYRAKAQDEANRRNSGEGLMNDSVKSFLNQIEENQESIFPKEFDFVTWKKNKQITEKKLLFGDLIERMRVHIKSGGDAQVTNRVYADEGPKSDTIKKDTKIRAGSDFLRHGVQHGGGGGNQKARRSSEFLRRSVGSDSKDGIQHGCCGVGGEQKARRASDCLRSSVGSDSIATQDQKVVYEGTKEEVIDEEDPYKKVSLDIEKVTIKNQNTTSTPAANGCCIHDETSEETDSNNDRIFIPIPEQAADDSFSMNP